MKTSGRWYPILSVYYLTYRCRFRCSYCSDGSGIPYHSLKDDTPDAAIALEIIERIRKHTDHIVITGGEPLDHPDLQSVLEGIALLRFRTVTLTTNGYDILRHLKTISRSVTTLVFSLDTLDPLKADTIYGAGRGKLQRILGNIETASGFRNRKYDIIISSVVTPYNIPDLYMVYEYAAKRDFIFAACPQLAGVRAHKYLKGNMDYIDFYDFLIREKKKGRPVYGTVKYLEYMRDLARFECSPFTMLVVSPSGNVYYPCLEKGHNPGKIHDFKNLHDIRLEGFRRFGGKPSCGTQCHSACALGFAIILKYPGEIFREALLLLISRLRSFAIRASNFRS